MTSHDSNSEFLALHTMRVRGFPSTDAVRAVLGLNDVAVADLLEHLAASGLCSLREGRITGWRLTDDGRAHHERLLDDARSDESAMEALRRSHQQFEPFNAAFKQLCTDWQLRDGAMNDHSDASYDAAVLTRLRAVHESLRPVLESLCGAVPRIGDYAERFAAALVRIDRGETDAVARPLSESYHDVWMELHQDFIVTLGLVRTSADA